MKGRLFTHARLATMVGQGYGAVEDAALLAENGAIAWLGSMATLPEEVRRSAVERVDLAGRWITPGLIDCHTHLVFAGNRAREFAQRLRGASYEEIAEAGGGILATVRATRAASEAELLAAAESRLGVLMRDGVTLVEIKSGYGLTLDDELKLLRVARRLGQRQPVTVVTTFLGAHVVPPEYAGRADAYVDHVCDEILPAVVASRLADGVDVFCDRIAFSTAQTERLFVAARHHGLHLRIHAEQLSIQGGAALAARFGALSADHLEWLDEDGALALAQSGTVAVLLPGASYFLREQRRPPVDLLRRHGVPMAVATDSNPGTSPLVSLRLAMNMACTLFGLTPEEALAAVTRHAARALGQADRRGALVPGLAADLAIWNVDHPAELSYWMGSDLLHARVRGGEVVG